jgi:murein endopeptidase
MIQSEKDLRYYQMPDLYGIAKVRKGMVWGKRHMIEFLIRLEREWTRDFYWQLDTHNNFAKVPLGDISLEGGSPPRSVVPKVNGHSSHRCGIDVDIYVISQDAVPREKVTHQMATVYDLQRTLELGKAILAAGGKDVADVFIGDERVVQSMRSQSAAMGLNLKVHQDSPMHDNHFHIRLENKDNDPSC